MWLVFKEHHVLRDWIIVMCHMFVSNLIIVKNGWTGDTESFRAVNKCSLKVVFNIKLTFVQPTVITPLSDVHSIFFMQSHTTALQFTVSAYRVLQAPILL